MSPVSVGLQLLGRFCGFVAVLTLTFYGSRLRMCWVE